MQATNVMRRLIFILITSCLTGFQAFAIEQYVFTRISQKEGLTSTVNCIYKEQEGDVWIGAPNGLFRFNGKTLSRYEDKALSGGVNEILLDKEGNFWVLTSSGLICRRQDEESFKDVTSPEDSIPVPYYCSLRDEEGVWFGGDGRLARYSYSTKELEIFSEGIEEENLVIKNIHSLDNCTLLCSSPGGLILFDIISKEISRISFTSRTEISKSFIDSKGHIWIALYNNGIEIYNKERQLIRTIRSSDTNLSSDIVLCMTEHDGKVWAGTDGGGVNIIDINDYSISILSHISGDASSFPAHSIKSIYRDSDGNIWAGSVRDGLIRVSKSGMKTYTDVHIGMNNGLSNPTVLCLHQDEGSDLIWIGTDGEGVNCFNPNKNEFTHFKSTLKNKVVSIAGYSESELAISVYSDRIWLFNKRTGLIRPLPIKDPDINYNIRYAGRSINLYDENKDNLLLLGRNVKRYNKSTGECTYLNIEGGTGKRNMFFLGKTAEGIWIHDAYSIYLLQQGEDTLKKVLDLGVLINSGDFGRDGTLWLATKNGVYKCNTLSKEANLIKTHLFTNATSIICDNNSRVWVGTDDALYAYLPEADRFAIFGHSDGASSNEYLPKPRLLSNRNEVYLGGIKGLLYIDESYSIDSVEKPLIKLDEIEVDHKSIKLGKKTSFRLPAGSKTLSLSVNVHEKDIFRQKRFRFYLSSNSYIESVSPTLRFPQLPSPGTYPIMVSCTKRNGEWSTPTEIIALTIPQPWYFSWWFILIICMSAAGIAAGTYLSQKRRKEHQIKLAIKEHEQEVYEEKVKMLINICHELRTPLTLIMAPLNRLLNTMEAGQDNYSTLNRIYRQSHRMKDLLNMVLDLRKMEEGKNQPSLEKIKFNRWVAAEIEDFMQEERAEGIEITMDTDPDLGLVEFDMKMCETIMTNIMVNAMKHSSKGDTITVSTYLTEDKMARVCVSDQGPGLGDTDTEKLFTKFYQSKSEHYGSGIGLSYSKILVELHGGSIGAYNNEDKGATFWWEIPITGAVEAMEEVPVKEYLNELLGHDIEYANSESEYKTTSAKILVVDDNQDLLDFIKESLSGAFSDIVTTTSGNKALNIIRSGKLPDIIISDINMPDGDGFRLCSEIKRDDRFSHIPVLLLTARGEEQSQSDSYRAGADAFLPKPFEIDTLMDLIKSLLKKRADIRKKYLDTSTDTPTQYGSNEESFIIRLNTVIAQHLGNPELDQNLLCKEMGMSRATLFNKMKHITGTGAKEYITKLRIDKAKHLLETTTLSLSEISEMTGFTSQSYFSTAFKTSVGMTPSQYKKKAGN